MKTKSGVFSTRFGKTTTAPNCSRGKAIHKSAARKSKANARMGAAKQKRARHEAARFSWGEYFDRNAVDFSFDIGWHTSAPSMNTPSVAKSRTGRKSAAVKSSGVSRTSTGRKSAAPKMAKPKMAKPEVAKISVKPKTSEPMTIRGRTASQHLAESQRHADLSAHHARQGNKVAANVYAHGAIAHKLAAHAIGVLSK